MTDTPTPALFDHAMRVYEEMKKRATKQVRPDVRGGSTVTDEDFILVYEGHLTSLFRDLDIANPYYTKIRQALIGQNCIQQIRRGGGSALSKWVVGEAPTEDTFKSILERKRAGHGIAAQLRQQIKDLSSTVNDLYGRVEVLEATKGKHEIDIQNLQRKVDAL